jgi:hypothetical protein
VAAIGNGNASCDRCHPGNPPSGHPDGSTPPARLINMDLEGDGGPYDDAGSYGDISSAGVDPDGVYDYTTGKCSNINCHSNQLTPAWYGGGVPTASPVTYGVQANGTTDLVIQKGTLVNLTGTVDDISGGGHPIMAAEYFLDTIEADGTGSVMDSVDGFDTATEGVQALSIDTSGWSVGDHWLYVHGQDGTDGWGNTSAVKVTIWDADTVTLSATDIASGSATQGGQYAFLRMDFTVTNAGDGQAVIGTVRLDQTGLAADADISQVAIYDDSGSSSGSWDTGDVLLGSGVFSGGQVSLDIINQTVTNPSTTTLFGVLTISATANTTSNTVALTVDNTPTYVTVASPDLMENVSSPAEGGPISIVEPGGGAPTASPVTYGVQADGGSGFQTDLVIQKGTLVSLTATVDDVSGGGHPITAAEYFLDTVGIDGNGTAMSASDGTFDTSTEGVLAIIGCTSTVRTAPTVGATPRQ